MAALRGVEQGQDHPWMAELKRKIEERAFHPRCYLSLPAFLRTSSGAKTDIGDNIAWSSVINFSCQTRLGWIQSLSSPR